MENFSDNIKKVLLAGIGAVAVTGEKSKELLDEMLKQNEGVQFSHTLDEQIRGQIKAGFKLTDLYEDTNGSGKLHEFGIPTFWATLAQKI